jgi:hypothetical protein
VRVTGAEDCGARQKRRERAQAAKPLWAEAEARFENVLGQANAVGPCTMMRQATAVALYAATEAPVKIRRK